MNRGICAGIIALLAVSGVFSATYYISSSSGDDGRTAAQAQNQSTPWQTPGKLSTVTVTIDQGWNFEVTQPDSSCIRLFLGKKLGVNEIKEENAKKNQRPFFSYLGAFFGAAVALSVVVVAIINK